MRTLISFISSVVSLLHLQLTQSVALKEDYDPQAQTCYMCYSKATSFLKVYLQLILQSSQHPPSILILTDSIIRLNSHELKPLRYSYAIANLSILDQLDFNALFPSGSKPFFVLDLSEALIEKATNQIYEAYKSSDKEWMMEWQPTISIVWRKSVQSLHKQNTALKNIFKRTELYINTNLFVYFWESSSLGIVSVWEVYNIKMKRFYRSVKSFSIKELLENHSTEVVQLSTLHEELESYARRRRNFHLENLTASIKFNPKYDDWIGVGMKDEDTYFLTGGYVAVLYWDLQLMMNFSEHILLGDSPAPLANGSLGGITVDQLRSGEIDISLNQISFSELRAKALTFLQPTYYSLTYVFFKQPSANSIRDIVITAFSKELWIALIGVWAMLVISTKVRPTPLYQNDVFSSSYDMFSSRRDDKKFASESVLWSVAAFCQKTWYMDPSSISLRMKFLIGSIVGFLSYTAYSGSIVSSLAVNKIPVKTFTDLINFNFIFTVHEHSEPFQTMLKGMIKSFELPQDLKTVSTKEEISHLFARPPTLHKSPSGLKSAKRAFLSSADMFYKTAEAMNFSSSFICRHISSFSASTYPSKSAMLVRKGSQFKEVLNYMFIYLRQRGLIYRNIDKYDTKNFLKCLPMDQQDSKVDPATWIDVFTIFLLFTIGLLSAVLSLLVEIVYTCCYCYWKRKTVYRNLVTGDFPETNDYYAGFGGTLVENHYFTAKF